MRLALTPEAIANALPEARDVAFVSDKGGQKVVFACTVGGDKCALKILPEHGGEEGETKERIARARREVATLRLCRSRHLAGPGPLGLGRVEIGDTAYLFFTEEFVEGTDLEELVKAKGTLPVGEVARLGADIADAVEELWSHKRIHRDIKPGNVMQRGADSSFVLLDCGIIYDVSGEPLTRPGYWWGTVGYAAPEQVDTRRKRDMDFRSDLFSLGVVMYEALSGRHPFRRRAMAQQEVIQRTCTYAPRPPSAVNPCASGALDDVIMRLLAKKPHLRFRRCRDLRSALEQSGLMRG